GDGAAQWLDDAGDTLAFVPGPSISVDVTDFCQRVAAVRGHRHPPGALCPGCRQAASEAVALYRADFLADFAPRECAEFETWMATEREHLRLEAAWLLAALADDAAASAHWDAAIDSARRWVTLEPQDEAAHRKVMLYYAWSDRRTLALRQ